MEIIENRSVGPTLGAQNIRNSLIAAGSGTALVGVFMVIIYRLPGAVACWPCCSIRSSTWLSMP